MTTESRPGLLLEGCHQCGLPSVTFRDTSSRYVREDIGEPACDDHGDSSAPAPATTAETEDVDLRDDEFPAAQSF